MKWDLADPNASPCYKREFTTDELYASPITPPVKRMQINLNKDMGYRYFLGPMVHQGRESLLTLRDFFGALTKLMYTPDSVPHAYWARTPSSLKSLILSSYLHRTGKTMPTNPPHRRPKTWGQLMEETVVEGAKTGMTKLLPVDLLAGSTLFAGMEWAKETGEWVLRTISHSKKRSSAPSSMVGGYVEPEYHNPMRAVPVPPPMLDPFATTIPGVSRRGVLDGSTGRWVPRYS